MLLYVCTQVNMMFVHDVPLSGYWVSTPAKLEKWPRWYLHGELYYNYYITVHPNVYIQVTPRVSLPVRALIFKKSLIECYRNYIEAGCPVSIISASPAQAKQMKC
jgi:hypothetical protein